MDQDKLKLWVTSLSDTPHLQYYDVQTLEYRYISKLPTKNERIWSYVKETTSHLQNKLSWIIPPSKFWKATIFLHAHLQVLYYICVKFHKNPISRLGGVADGQGDSYIPPPPQTLFARGIIIIIIRRNGAKTISLTNVVWET